MSRVNFIGPNKAPTVMIIIIVALTAAIYFTSPL